MIMGRKTFESLGRVLPGRWHIVVSRSGAVVMPAKGDISLVTVVAGFDEALALFGCDERAFVIGGTEMFSLALPIADRLELTMVHGKPEGGAFFLFLTQRNGWLGPKMAAGGNRWVACCDV